MNLQTTFKIILGMSPYRLVFEKACHLSIELKYRALRVIKQLNFNLDKAGDLQNLQIFELEELRNEAYENVKITESRVKIFHDKLIMRKTFISGKKSYFIILAFIFCRETEIEMDWAIHCKDRIFT